MTAVIRFVVCFFLITFSLAWENNISDENLLRPPLDINLYVAGTFGEPRGDHFHTGIDFSTRGKTGLEVKAVADGYVSRIKSAGRRLRSCALHHAPEWIHERVRAPFKIL